MSIINLYSASPRKPVTRCNWNQTWTDVPRWLNAFFVILLVNLTVFMTWRCRSVWDLNAIYLFSIL